MVLPTLVKEIHSRNSHGAAVLKTIGHYLRCNVNSRHDWNSAQAICPTKRTTARQLTTGQCFACKPGKNCYAP